MATANIPAPSRPMADINTTPLIDVLLVLLIMIIITIPAATHTVEVTLPGKGEPQPVRTDPIRNRVVLTGGGAILWNGTAVSGPQFGALLKQTLAYPVEPELQLQPEAEASYELSAKVIAVIKQAKVTKFGFVDNERFGNFGKAEGAR